MKLIYKKENIFEALLKTKWPKDAPRHVFAPKFEVYTVIRFDSFGEGAMNELTKLTLKCLEAAYGARLKLGDS